MTNRCVLALGVSLMVVAPSVGAQDDATITGRVVHKATKAGIGGAEVLLAPGALRLVSDSAGFFRFDRVRPGPLDMLVRRIGFSPESASFEVRAREDLDVLIELRETAQPLDTVTVAGRSEPIPRGKLSAYYQRKRLGIGAFIDGKALDEDSHRQLADVILSRTAGSRIIRGNRGSIAWIASTRDGGARPAGMASIDPIDRALGADPQACYPDVYLDGVNVYSFGFGRRLFDISSIPTSNVSAIEFYSGTARIPPQYSSSSSACGVLLIWTK